jgi:hypothetical protein
MPLETRFGCSSMKKVLTYVAAVKMYSVKSQTGL